MSRRFTLAVAILALAAVALFPGVASAQAGSPPAVAGTVIEAGPAAPAAAPAVAGQALPRTGSDVLPMAVGAVALLLVGTLLVVTTRRRRDDGTVTLA